MLILSPLRRVALLAVVACATLLAPPESVAVNTVRREMPKLDSYGQPVSIVRGRNSATTPQRLDLQRGHAAALETSFRISRLAVGDPSIVDFVLLGEQEVQVVAKSVGDTNLLIWEAGHLQAVIDVHVGTVNTAIIEELQRILDNPNVNVDMAGNSIILTGSVPNIVEYEHAGKVAQAFLGKTRVSTGFGKLEGDADELNRDVQVINLLKVGGNQQVMIEIAVAEVRKEVSHAFGINILGAVAIDDQKTVAFQTLLNNLASNPEMLAGPEVPGNVSKMAESVSLAGAFFESDSLDIRAFMELVEASKIGTILAEPTVVARSGELAEFLVGGEVPIPIISAQNFGGNQWDVKFKKFGVNVVFTPTVLAHDQIHMQILSEVSEPDFSYGVRVLGSSVPAFQTRRVDTSLELGDGQSFIMGGLMREDIVADIEQYPFLGDIPVLGNLFKSRHFQKRMTELVMVITPRLVKPLPPGPIELPTDHYIEPNKREFYWDGIIQGRPKENDPSKRPLYNPSAAGMETSDDGGMIGTFGQRLEVPEPTGGNL